MIGKHFRKQAMKAAIMQIVDLAEHEVGGHLTEIEEIVWELDDEQLDTYKRRLGQLQKVVKDVQKERRES